MLERELAEASRMAREAGRIVLELYGDDIEVGFKGVSNPVTEADTRANAYLVEELERLFPEDGVVAEESQVQSEAVSKRRCWYVDPLDGTKEFIKQNGEFAVMIGLAIEGESRLGVVYQPVADKLYRGVIGEGASMITGGDAIELRVSEITPAAALKLVVSRSHRSASIDQVVQQLAITDEVCSGSVGLKIGMIAERRADLYVHVSDKSCRWDACGPEAVVRAAGGRFTDLAGDPFVYAGTDVANRRGIVACNRASYDEVLPAVRAAGESAGLIV